MREPPVGTADDAGRGRSVRGRSARSTQDARSDRLARPRPAPEPKRWRFPSSLIASSDTGASLPRTWRSCLARIARVGQRLVPRRPFPSRPLGSQCRKPLATRGFCSVGAAGFEPATFRPADQRARRLVPRVVPRALSAANAQSGLHAESPLRKRVSQSVGATGFEPATFRPPAERFQDQSSRFRLRTRSATTSASSSTATGPQTSSRCVQKRSGTRHPSLHCRAGR